MKLLNLLPCVTVLFFVVVSPPIAVCAADQTAAQGKSTASTTPLSLQTPIDCKIPFWEKGIINATNVRTSSDASGRSAATSQSNCCRGSIQGGWCPDSQKVESNEPQYIEVTFDRPLGIKAIEIQAPEGTGPNSHVAHFMTYYSLQYEPFSGGHLIDYSVPHANGPVVMRGVESRVLQVVSTRTEITGLVTRRIRLVVKEYHGEPCFRFEIYGCEQTGMCSPKCGHGGVCVYEDICRCPVPFYGPGCQRNHATKGPCVHPLGMSNGRIESSQLFVSSSAPTKSKDRARFGCCAGTHNGAWCPNPGDTSPYFEVHFRKPMIILEIMFQHPSTQYFWDTHDTYLKTFSLQYTESNSLVMYADRILAILNGTVSYTVDLEPHILTDRIRISPLTWEKAPCFRFELIGCDPDDPLLPDSGFGKRKRRGIRYRISPF